jgi:subtilisin family serine protease
VSSPATAKNILSVGASENLLNTGGIQKKAGEVCTANGCLWPAEPIASDTFSNNPNGLAAFSSRGPTQDGRIKPEIVAPGTNILSDCSHLSDASALWGRFNTDYCYSGGTSMSTPLVAGAAAVTRQYLQKKFDNPSAALVKATLLHSAFDLYPGQYGEVGREHGQEILTHAPNADEGYGRVDIDNMLKQRLTFVDEKSGVSTGEQKTYQVPSGGVRKVTLVYTDYPASPATSAALVNNLDLEVRVGDQVFKSASTVNNTEQVTIDGAARGGPVTIVVVGTNVPMGKNGRQPYALVYSN